MAKKLGQRVSVFVGNNKKGKPLYSYMLITVQSKLGFTADPTPTTKNRKGKVLLIRGYKGSGSIKIPYGPAKVRRGVTYQPTLRVPIPPGIDLIDQKKFVKKATRKAEDYFISKDGRQHSIH